MSLRAVASAWTERLGVAGVVGVALLAFAAAFQLGTIGPESARKEALERDQSKLEQARAPGSEPVRTPQEDLSAFYAMLPEETAIPAFSERVYALGAALGVPLRQGSYRHATDEGAGYARYEVTYQTQAAYYRVRLFLRDLLREMPALALDDVAFQRQQANAPSAETTLKLVLFVRRG